ncbi:gluconate 2-dehydrogenase subunit 3 family protein [Streptomyces sp. ET3-23]|uniref:GMC family oxidoreductase n=1 Tax=Streptomyces sp. ET3-23 TaxID=2885643 RepID=UPI001D113A84|nr:GMC family oxidoreductase [Streptomyces sp. ET3-23]MCC2274425.1 gluconate 2-dehydrogenase subunit 3 family protein [Streptomyces sp. ET3-23]
MARGGPGDRPAMTPGRHPTRFPGYDVLAQTGTWDATTQAVVLARTARQPEMRFFSLAEEAVATALFDHLLAQWDDPRVPVLEMVDARLAEMQTDGWRYADMPEDDAAWRLSLKALDDDAHARHDRPFAELPRVEQAQLIQAVHDTGGDRWHGMTASRVWGLWTRYTATAFYSHPWAWNEIGFGGPAYPRGYLRLGLDRREPWETPHRPDDGGGNADGAAAGDDTKTPGRRSPRRPGTGAAGAGAALATLRRSASPLRRVRARNASAWLLPRGDARLDHELVDGMRRFADDDEVDLVIVGCGAGGATLAQRMSRHGWSVVCLEAGPFWNPDADWVSDEAGSHHLYWTDPRVIAGSDPVPLGSNNSGRGVGGSTVHFAGYVPRFHPSDFRTYSEDGVGADWPLSYEDLRASYERIEEELPVAGQYWPWGDPHAYPHAPHPLGGNGEVFLRGAAALGIEARVGPVAITNGRFGNRPHCIYRGFCLQGCKVNAKASALITHVPDALANGAEIRAQSMATGIELDAQGLLATGVRYVRNGRERFQRARMVAVAGYSLETPRLLLNSANRRFPDGLCNDHDLVGRYVMVQGAPQVAGRFAEEVRAYKAPPPEVTTEQFYETDPTRPYRRGFSVQNVSPLPIVWAEHVAAQGHWGEDLRSYMQDYVHWAVLGALCELLPLPGNRVTLAEEKDRYGLPVAHFAYSQCENDRQLIRAAETVMEDILRAAGAGELMTINRYAHLVGGCRMARDAEHGVVDADLRSFAVPNLLITDGSVLPTQGSANPALTIMALVDRAAARLAAGARSGLRSPAGSRR